MKSRKRDLSAATGVITVLLLGATAAGEDFANQELKIAIDNGSDDALLFVTLEHPKPRKDAVCSKVQRASLDPKERAREKVISREISATN